MGAPGPLGDDPDRWDPHWESVHLGIWSYARDAEALATAMEPVRKLCGATLLESVTAADEAERPGALQREGRDEPAVDPRRPSTQPRGGPTRRGQDRDLERLAAVGARRVRARTGRRGQRHAGRARTRRRSSSAARSPPCASSPSIAERLADVVGPLSPICTEPTPLDRLVGRRSDGTPLIAAPDDNRFRYRDDPEGLGCPITAHIRRANRTRRAGIRRHPRQPAADDPPAASPTPPMIDRGGTPSGLMFVVAPGSARRPVRVRAAILAQRRRRLRPRSRSRCVGRPLDRWASPGRSARPGRPARGHGHVARARRRRVAPYFLLPSIRGLHYLAQGVGGRLTPDSFHRATSLA